MSWTEDGSGNLKVEGDKVVYTGAGHNKANSLWSQGGSGYWQFKIQGESALSLGVSSRATFGPGYNIRGLFYNGSGNLSEGGKLVRSGWGPRLADNDVVGMKVEQNTDRTRVSFSHNGVGLGTAFDIANWGDELCPAVGLEKQGQTVTIMPGDMSSSRTDDARRAGEGFEGNWTGAFPINIRRQPNDWRVAAFVGNNYVTAAKINADGSLSAGMPVGTQKMLPPEQRVLEEKAKQFLGGITGIRREGERLVVESTGGRQEFTYAPPASSAYREDIPWMN